MKLAVVIVNYDSSDDLARCLASLHRQPARCDHAIVVVDNASRDPGLDRVRSAYPGVRWLLNRKNLGYARGANLGVAAVPADFALILNPDIEVLPGAVDALLALADARPRAGIVAPQLLGLDGGVQHSARRFYTLRTLLLRRTPLRRLFPNSRSVREHLMLDFDHGSERAVDWVLGGALLVRRQARERVGPLDERFFLYFEDIDWCYRMWQAGWEVLYTPAARFIHGHRRASTQGAFRREFWSHMGSMISFYEKWGLVLYVLKKWRRPLGVLLLWLLDMAALGGALLVAYLLRAALQPLFPEQLFPLAEYRALFLFAWLLATAAFILLGRYDRTRRRKAMSASGSLTLAGLVSLLLLAATFLSHQRLYSRPVLLIFVPLFWLGLGAVGIVYAAIRARMGRDDLTLDRTLLVGSAEALSAWLAARRDLRRDGIDPVGYLCDRTPGAPEPGPLGAGDLPWLGPRDALVVEVARHRVSQVLFWEAPRGDAAEAEALGTLLRNRVRLRWHLVEGGLLATARPESYGGFSSLVLEPRLGARWSRLAGVLSDRGAGLLLLVLSGIPYLVARAGGAATTRFTWRGGGGGEPVRLNLIPGRTGRPRPLWWQAPLGWDLLAGGVELYGPEASSGPVDAMWGDLACAPEQFEPVPAAEAGAEP